MSKWRVKLLSDEELEVDAQRLETYEASYSTVLLLKDYSDLIMFASTTDVVAWIGQSGYVKEPDPIPVVEAEEEES